MVLCVYVCMPLDIGSHACFPVNLKASGWSQGCGLFSHSLPPSLIPEEVLLLGYSATLSISPGKSWSRGGPPHILSTDSLPPPNLLSHHPLSPKAMVKLPAFASCGLPPHVRSSKSPTFSPGSKVPAPSIPISLWDKSTSCYLRASFLVRKNWGHTSVDNQYPGKYYVTRFSFD